MEEQLQPVKLKLTRKLDQELKIFFIIARRPPPIMEEKIVVILAYALEDAFQNGKATNPGFNLFFTGQSMTIKELLGRINSEGANLTPDNIVKEFPEILKIKKDPEKISFEQFKNGLLLVANDLIESEKDKQTLKRIIDDLKFKPKV